MAFEFNYQLTEKAVADLDATVGYIAGELDNPQAAAEFLEKLQKAIDEARMFPESGAPVENAYLPYTGIRKKLIGNRRLDSKNTINSILILADPTIRQ